MATAEVGVRQGREVLQRLAIGRCGGNVDVFCAVEVKRRGVLPVVIPVAPHN